MIFILAEHQVMPACFLCRALMENLRWIHQRIVQKDDPLYEDMGVLFFDADGDKDLDLYIVSGSYEIPPNHPISNDRLFINDGKGKFTKSTNALP